MKLKNVRELLLTLMAVLLTAATSSFAAETVRNDWENPAINSVNRLPSRTYSMPLENVSAAFADALEPETPYKKSLNGTWKLSWSGNPELRVKDFWRVDFDDSAWFDIEVPGCVELSGFGSPGYTNINYPHADLSHPTNAAFATIRDRKSGKADYNPVSSYRMRFTVPEAWKDRRVILRFDGVYSAYYVWVNGKKVGYAEDSKLPSEFDVTEFVGCGENVLAVEVFRWCDGSYLEDQDMTRFSGIFRDVTLWSMPKDGIWDFVVRTTPLDGYKKWNLEVKLEGEGEQRISAALYDADKMKVCDLNSTSTPNIYTSTLAARAWSAEKPYLYTLVLKKGADIRMKRVGFKEQKIVGHTFFVNGQKIKFKGVNRHETNPERGRSVTLDDMIRDITLMKRYNINTVRTSHYPDHHLWYDLCDRYGIYLCAEANVEGHEPGYGKRGLGSLPQWAHSIIERNMRHALFCRNHPCVTIWSMGNETGHGDDFRKAISEVRKVDPSRPIHWHPGNEDADIDSSMYPSVPLLEARGRFGDSAEDLETTLAAIDAACGKGRFGDELRRHHTVGKCSLLTEYAHAMGNAIGNLEEYWKVIYAHDSLIGGCIWDWVDQALWKETGRVDPKTGGPERYLAYGGDWDEAPNDGPFCCNGVVDPERHVTAKLIEVGHVYRNLVVTRPDEREGDGLGPSFELWNRFGFTRADEFAGVWKLRENGKVTKTGGFETPKLQPLARCRFTIQGLAEALATSAPGSELYVDFEFATTKDEPWAKRGWVVARDQVALGKGWDFSSVKSGADGASPKISESGRTVSAECWGTKAVFSRRTGTLCELEMSGRTVLKDSAPGLAAGPRLTCARAFTDNDLWLREKFYDSGLTQLRYHARPIEVRDGTVRTVIEVTGSKSAGFIHEALWRLAADGSIVMENIVTPHGTMPPALPRLGLTLRLAGNLDVAKWYGRGPRENYVDRRSGSFLGIWNCTVEELAEPYVRPQDNGFRSDVRWFSLSAGDDGHGVRFAASEPMFVQALRCGWEDLEFARHRPGQQRFRSPVVDSDDVYLNLDVRQLGLGGGSCGPRTLDEYIFRVEKTSWTVRFAPVDEMAKTNAGEVGDRGR